MSRLAVAERPHEIIEKGATKKSVIRQIAGVKSELEPVRGLLQTASEIIDLVIDFPKPIDEVIPIKTVPTRDQVKDAKAAIDLEREVVSDLYDKLGKYSEDPVRHAHATNATIREILSITKDLQPKEREFHSAAHAFKTDVLTRYGVTNSYELEALQRDAESEIRRAPVPIKRL